MNNDKINAIKEQIYCTFENIIISLKNTTFCHREIYSVSTTIKFILKCVNHFIIYL